MGKILNSVFITMISFSLILLFGCDKMLKNFGIQNREKIEGNWTKIEKEYDGRSDINSYPLSTIRISIKKYETFYKIWYSTGSDSYYEKYQSFVCDDHSCQFVEHLKESSEKITRKLKFRFDTDSSMKVDCLKLSFFWCDNRKINYYLKTGDAESGGIQWFEENFPGD